MTLTLKDLFCKFITLLSSGLPGCRLVEVNTSLQEVVVHVRNRSVFLKCKLGEAVSDLSIIDQLDPAEACWLGGYFGRALRSSLEGRDAIKKAKSMSFLLSNKRGRYMIIFQNRNDEIGYIDKKTQREFVEHPLTVANNEHIISGFDPSQACYIGILAGISMEKAISMDKKTGQSQLELLLNKPPRLRIVK